MGQTLSEPIVTKTSERGEDDRLLYGVSAMQGWRISMEDAHTAILDLASMAAGNAKQTPAGERMSFFGVYDGHGGQRVALFAGENIHHIVAKQDKFKAGDYEGALKDGFLATDSAILRLPGHEDEVSGCTACVGLVTRDRIYIANAGDSRSVLGTRGRAKPLSQDHKPQLETEKARIQAAGGFVDFGRVNGNLALSRAIGDFEFKKNATMSPEAQIVTAYPDVEEHQLTDDDEFMVIACDGIWDCQSSQAVVEFVRRGIVAKQDLDKICENLMDNCVASNSETGGVGCDNMTMIIVGFLRGRTKQEWYEEISRRVADGDGPCAPVEYAEFRGPGVHHNFDDGDHDDDDEHREFGLGSSRGRVILLGDGSHVVTEMGDAEMLDQPEEEEKDLASQVERENGPASTAAPDHSAAKAENDSARTENSNDSMDLSGLPAEAAKPAPTKTTDQEST